jgi:predicted NACHT family NTPase
MPVTLRDYGLAREDRQLSIVDFIEEACNTDFQLQPPKGAIEYMMQQGRALVIFDGLDELVNPTRRRVIRDDIEAFWVRFPATRVLVTAREIGYEQAPMDAVDFNRFRLSEFDDDQVGAYVHRWFGAHPDIASQQRDRQAAAFLRESQRVVSDLRRNPLLLALMCNIYKGEGYIPTNRPDVYEKCSNMLLRRWDATRNIESQRPLGAHLERTLEYLATEGSPGVSTA